MALHHPTVYCLQTDDYDISKSLLLSCCISVHIMLTTIQLSQRVWYSISFILYVVSSLFYLFLYAYNSCQLNCHCDIKKHKNLGKILDNKGFHFYSCNDLSCTYTCSFKHFKYYAQYIISHVMWKPVFGVFEQVWLRPVCSATVTS